MLIQLHWSPCIYNAAVEIKQTSQTRSIGTLISTWWFPFATFTTCCLGLKRHIDIGQKILKFVIAQVKQNIYAKEAQSTKNVIPNKLCYFGHRLSLYAGRLKNSSRLFFSQPEKPIDYPRRRRDATQPEFGCFFSLFLSFSISYFSISHIYIYIYVKTIQFHV